jgi:hypothetical protein
LAPTANVAGINATGDDLGELPLAAFALVKPVAPRTDVAVACSFDPFSPEVFADEA